MGRVQVKFVLLLSLGGMGKECLQLLQERTCRHGQNVWRSILVVVLRSERELEECTRSLGIHDAQTRVYKPTLSNNVAHGIKKSMGPPRGGSHRQAGEKNIVGTLKAPNSYSFRRIESVSCGGNGSLWS